MARFEAFGRDGRDIVRLLRSMGGVRLDVRQYGVRVDLGGGR